VLKCDLAKWILDFNENTCSGVYKSTGKNFERAFHAYIFKFSKMLIEQAANNDKVNRYLSSYPGWKKFETDVHDVRIKKDTMKLASTSEKREEDDENDLNCRDENFNTDEPLNKEDEDKEDEGKEDGNDEKDEKDGKDEKEKLNILPEDEDEEPKDTNIEAKNAAETLASGNERDKVIFEEVDENIINPNIQDPNVQDESERKPKVYLDEMKQSDIEPESIIGKVPEEFTGSNYWETRSDIKLEDLEPQYES